MTRWLPDQLKEIRAWDDRWLEGVYWIYPVQYQNNSLHCWVSAEHAAEMENLSEKVVGKGVMKLLRNFTGNFTLPYEPKRVQK